MQRGFERRGDQIPAHPKEPHPCAVAARLTIDTLPTRGSVVSPHVVTRIEHPRSDVRARSTLGHHMHRPTHKAVVDLTKAEAVCCHQSDEVIQALLIPQLRRPQFLCKPLAERRHIPARPVVPVALCPPVGVGLITQALRGTSGLRGDRPARVRRGTEPGVQVIAEAARHGVDRCVPPVQRHVGWHALHFLAG
eukprot:scaffold292225_cov26-Tisochrysis_lutea.AAC.3